MGKILIFLLMLFVSCSNQFNKFETPNQLLNKNIEIINQSKNNFYYLTLYWDKQIGTKYLFIHDLINNTNVNYEILTSGGLRTNYIDIDLDNNKDLLFDVFIGGTGIHSRQFVLYSTKHKEIFYQNVNYDNKIKFMEHSPNINKDSKIKTCLRNFLYLTNRNFNSMFGI